MKIAQVRGFALSLPDATEAPHFTSTSFRVHGKIFATVPPGDAVVHVFVDEEARETALALEPGFLEKLFWGARACGLRVDMANAKARMVESLLDQAWRYKAPKQLVAARSASAGDVPAKPSARRGNTAGA